MSLPDQNHSYLSDFNAGDILMDSKGDKWKVVGQFREGELVCVDEPNDDPEALPIISIWDWESIQKMTLV